MNQDDIQTIDHQELAVHTPTPLEILQSALVRGVDADQLEKLMALQERFEANNARRAFATAMADFQARCPTVMKSKRADRYSYAPLDEVLRTIRPHLEKTGLAVRFSTAASAEGVVTAICTVSHRDGHTETSHFSAPIDRAVSNSGKPLMNCTQQVGSANSYAKRYALMNALGLVASEFEDDDGYRAGTPVITDQQVVELRDHIKALAIDQVKFLQYLGIDQLENLPAAKWDAAINAIERKRKAVEDSR